MKFFIFTCLLAVALARHESASIEQETCKKDKNVVFQANQETTSKIDEMVSPSSSSSEESTEVVTEKKEQVEEENIKQLNKIKQFYQQAYFPQYHQAYRHQQRVLNPWNSFKKNANCAVSILNKEDHSSTEESTRISQEEILKKIFDMNKINQFHQMAFPQYFQIFHPQRIAVNSWNNIQRVSYPYIPIVRNVLN